MLTAAAITLLLAGVQAPAAQDPRTMPPPKASEPYTLGSDSEVQPSVPHGRVEGPLTWKSAIFPGTIRQYWVYVPAQYDPQTPAAVMVFQDGHKYVNVSQEYRVPVVFDNLIARGEMPVTIGIFINPGHHGETLPADPWRGDDRSFEYDSLTGTYVRFLLEEILPEVGRKYRLTDDPERRAIAGASSGGICAFTAAWERPDAFRKVVSHIGSFTNIRGGHVYPALIRKTPRKPLRVFLQDGSTDLDNEHGNWPLANQQMEKAMLFANRKADEAKPKPEGDAKPAGPRYDVKFVLGEGAHNGKHGGSIFPDTLRWVWRDYPGVKGAPSAAADSK